MICLGLESTAHTFGIGIFDGKKILSDARDMYKPKKGGIHPIEAKKHHEEIKEKILSSALAQAKISLEDVDMLAYSAGPGLPPCLKVGAEFVNQLGKQTKKPIFAVNHPVAHIEIAKFMTGAKDPIIIYVSGGNTQIIGYAGGRYRIFGESMDISIGNAIDTFMRDSIGNPGFGGPVLDDLAARGKKYIELPYVVKGMDLSFSGIVTAALQKYKKDKTQLNDLCFSFQETCYAMLTEVAERALAHTGKSELLLTGGVAASKRLKEMLDIMTKERGAKALFCPLEYCGDNGVNIAVAGYLAAKAGQKAIKNRDADFNSRWRVDEVEVKWM